MNCCDTLGERCELEDGTSAFAILDAQGQPLTFQLDASQIVKCDDDYVQITSNHIKSFVKLEGDIFKMLKSRVSIKDTPALMSMLKLTDIDEDARPFIKLYAPDFEEIEEGTYNAVCKGVFIKKKKKVHVVWDISPQEEESWEDRITGVVQSEIQTLQAAAVAIEHMLGILKEIESIVVTDTDPANKESTAAVIDKFMANYFASKEQFCL
jgi:hypothetical protein